MGIHSFEKRHIGITAESERKMLKAIGADSLAQLIEETVPAHIRRTNEIEGSAMSEKEYLEFIWQVAAKNEVYRSFIGLGYHRTFTPTPILRNIFENPGWYTAYTPYQAEIAQGRMESLLNYQTMVTELTGMEIANASLLDEATAAAEAMSVLHSVRSKNLKNANKFFVDQNIYPQTLEVLKTRATGFEIEIVCGDFKTFTPDESYFGVMVQYPDANGEIHDYSQLVNACKLIDVKVAVAADLLSLTLLTPPGEWGADIVFGSSQRFGVPLGYGGPHAAFFCTKDDYKRSIPGRIIGVTVDSRNKRALRMALQTREQHIKRDKATSNICTAQALLANMAAMYAVYHGPQGLKNIALHAHQYAISFANAVKNAGFEIKTTNIFDTVFIQNLNSEQLNSIKVKAEEKKINLRFGQDFVSVTFDECINDGEFADLLYIFGAAGQVNVLDTPSVAPNFIRKSEFLTHPVFNTYHSETDFMRYINKLERKDIGLNYSMISLGSCTMKLNSASELMPMSWPEFNAIHPFAPPKQAAGYAQIIEELGKALCDVTGFDAVSFQPNSGAQGEYTGLMAIRDYLHKKGEGHRNIALIPQSAHGTNPASAVMAGMQVVVVGCDEMGNIDLADLEAKADAHKDNLAVLMITYPSTHGVYEETVKQACEIVHKRGGQVYMDGANMNAQVGLTSPGHIGADVCHLNLHKTFAIPHGGGGPGMGPICVRKHLAPHLPGHIFDDNKNYSVSAAPYGSPLILLISYAYVKMLGGDGMRRATEYAILNANYMMSRLDGPYKILYKGNKGRCAHEFILDCRDFKKTANIEVVDIAKRLMDYGFHAPTVSFPVAGTLMIEPTESESLAELDRFCDAMLSIREEIKEIELGLADKENNVLKNAPHTADLLSKEEWTFPYSRNKAVFPISWVAENKFWPSVGRVNDAYGDRNLICTCPPIESYELSEA